jgi:hypothetical protein
MAIMGGTTIVVATMANTLMNDDQNYVSQTPINPTNPLQKETYKSHWH